jgi:DNA-binding XRE family transcriptional regulator
MDNEEVARKRAELILKVRSGQMTAAAAAKALGVSRKTYYKWEDRALSAMLEALTDRQSGRPSQPVDGARASMAKKIAAMEKQLLLAEERDQIRTYMAEELEILDMIREKSPKKKRGSANDRQKHGETED